MQTHLQAAVDSNPAVLAEAVRTRSIDHTTAAVARAVVAIAMVDDFAVVTRVSGWACARQLVCVARASVHAERIVAVLHVTKSGERILEVALVAVTPEV